MANNRKNQEKFPTSACSPTKNSEMRRLGLVYDTNNYMAEKPVKRNRGNLIFSSHSNFTRGAPASVVGNKRIKSRPISGMSSSFHRHGTPTATTQVGSESGTPMGAYKPSHMKCRNFI